MARSRNIKPRFFTNEDLVELPFEARLLFIGLWTEADRLGRLGDRPKRLKMALFPADNIDIDLQLNSLAKAGFILRYEVNGERFIQVLNFDKHQSPHVKEVASTIPAPTEHEQKPVQEQQDIGKQGTSTVQAPDNTDAEPVLTALIPDYLIPDVLNPDSPSTDSQPATAVAKSGKPTRKPNKVDRPADWKPTDKHVAFAAANGLSLQTETTKFSNYHDSHASRFANWDAAFSTWLTNAVSFAGAGKVRPHVGFDKVNYNEGVGADGSF